MSLRCARLRQVLLFTLLASCAEAEPAALDVMLGPTTTVDSVIVERTSVDSVEVTPQLPPPAVPPTLSTAQMATGNDASIRIGFGAEVLAGNAQGEVFLANPVLHKLRADLSPIWQVALRGRAFAVVALADGGALAGGEYQRGDCVGFIKVCMRGFITRFDSDGRQLWTLELDQPSSAVRVTGLAAGDGQFYAAGQFSGELWVGQERVAIAQGGLDFFVVAISSDGARALWADTQGSSADDGDGPVLAAHPDGGVIAAGHLHDAESGFVHAYTATGGTHFAAEIQGHVSLFQLVVDGRGHIWTSGVMGGSVEFGDAQRPRRLVTRGQFDAFVLELDASGAPGSLLQLTSPTEGGVRSLGLAARQAGVWFVNDYGLHQLSSDTKQVVTRVAVIDAAGKARELAAFDMLGTFSRHAATTAADGALLWTGYAQQPTTFGLDQGTFPANRFLMRRTSSPD